MGQLPSFEHAQGWKAGVSKALLWVFLSGAPEERAFVVFVVVF